MVNPQGRIKDSPDGEDANLKGVRYGFGGGDVRVPGTPLDPPLNPLLHYTSLQNQRQWALSYW